MYEWFCYGFFFLEEIISANTIHIDRPMWQWIIIEYTLYINQINFLFVLNFSH